MDRRKSLKILSLSAVAPVVPNILFKSSNVKIIKEKYRSSWEDWPDMNWAGPDYWGNRLQDWRIRNGKVECVVRGKNRSLHSLVCQLREESGELSTSVSVQFQDNEVLSSPGNYAGFRIGAKPKNRSQDYRSAAVFGEGLEAGITTRGNLFIGKEKSTKLLDSKQAVRLQLEAVPSGGKYKLNLTAHDPATNDVLDEFIVSNVSNEDLTGNIALVFHSSAHGNEEVLEVTGTSDTPGVSTEDPSVSFDNWTIEGSKVAVNRNQTFGPVCFSQYTIHDETLKLTAQLAPVETIYGHKIFLQTKEGNSWNTIKEASIDHSGRTAHFRVENWKYTDHVPYRIKITLPLKNGEESFYYQGTIASQPKNNDQLKVGVFSCNCDYGFPDTEVAINAAKHKPDMVVFLGDQFYESHGGFGIQTTPLEKANLDYLRKWYMFGWSYRDLFRDIPCAIIPDDHDVYHGNVWGEGGKHAPSDEGWGYVAQDQGGYKMPPEFVNMVQRTQTSHLPDAYDPTPVKQGIEVYYTTLNYGGVSFAILEDRKFKSAPKNVLPEEADVANGFIRNPDFDIKAHKNIKADLLGDRQMEFLQDWSTNWNNGIQMKAVLSQTNFCTVATLPEGSSGDQIVPKLPIPDKGVYVTGDAPTVDMDSNGWPQKGRNEALKVIRKCFAFHIAGDQHLASVVQYGVDKFGDSGHAFAGPALNNLWPRRWWPSTNNNSRKPTSDKPSYTGNFYDGFGNRMTVKAVANPRKTYKEPAIIYDRATGYGMVTFNKKEKTIHTECWPRYIDPDENPDGQYEGWPVTISQEDNYGREAVAWLPTVKITGADSAVVEIIDESTEEIVYKTHIKGNKFKPKVFAKGKYTIRVSRTNSANFYERKHVSAKTKNNKTVLFSLA